MTAAAGRHEIGTAGPVARWTASELLLRRFVPLPDAPEAGDPLRWPGYPAKLEATRRQTGRSQAVRAGTAVVDGQACVALDFDFGFLGGSMGRAEGALIVAAIAHATRNRWPLVSIARSGGARMQEGTVSLFQMPLIARALVALAAAGVPHLAVADDPTTGGVWAALVAAADVVVARAGAQLAFAGNRVRPGPVAAGSPSTAEGKHQGGFVDVVAPDDELEATLGGYLRLLSPLTRGTPAAPPLPGTTNPRSEIAPDGWHSVLAARAPGRRPAEHYLNDYFEATMPLWGDRAGGVDPGMRCGVGRRDGQTIAFICQRGGATRAAGLRTAGRTLAIADRLHLAVVTFIDTAGADNGPAAEQAGVGTAIAQTMQQLARCRTPVLSLVVGQGVSGAAIALVNPDNLWMAPDSYLAVIAPESAAAILKQADTAVPRLADQLALSPRRLTELGLARGVL